MEILLIVRLCCNCTYGESGRGAGPLGAPQLLGGIWPGFRRAKLDRWAARLGLFPVHAAPGSGAAGPGGLSWGVSPPRAVLCSLKLVVSLFRAVKGHVDCALPGHVQPCSWERQQPGEDGLLGVSGRSQMPSVRHVKSSLGPRGWRGGGKELGRVPWHPRTAGWVCARLGRSHCLGLGCPSWHVSLCS